MGTFWAFSWVLIPLAGILAGAFKEWLQFKEKQNQLGSSTEKLEKQVETLAVSLKASESNRRALIERIQNLETIVTSQEWDTIEDRISLIHPEPAAAKNEVKEPGIDSRLLDDSGSFDSMNKAAQLAKRLAT